MTRASLDDTRWASLTLATQQVPRAWKRDEAALRRFAGAVPRVSRTGAPWRGPPDGLGH